MPVLEGRRDAYGLCVPKDFKELRQLQIVPALGSEMGYPSSCHWRGSFLHLHWYPPAFLAIVWPPGASLPRVLRSRDSGTSCDNLYFPATQGPPKAWRELGLIEHSLCRRREWLKNCK